MLFRYDVYAKKCQLTDDAATVNVWVIAANSCPNIRLFLLALQQFPN